MTDPAQPAGAVVRLHLYGRAWCHLCEDMRAALEALRGELALNFEIVEFDVDADPALEALYDELVPVLTDAAGNRLCHYFLDRQRVLEAVGG